MFNKKIIPAAAVAVVLVTGILSAVLVNKKEEPVSVEEKEPVKEVVKQPTVKVKPAVPKPVVKKFDLYSSTPYDIPLISVVEISKLSDKAKKSVDEVLEASQGFYFLKFNEDSNKAFIVLQNPISSANTYRRHDLEIVEISSEGEKTFHNAAFSGVDGETSNAVQEDRDVWEFDKTVDPARPLKHIAYDEEGNVRFTEIWNYSDKDPVKYEMKNSDNKPVSILKESFENDSNYRKEHIFYDENGNTKMSITANYDGANLSRFTYYNVDDKDDSISIMSEYSEDGLKSKEYIYNTDYELTNTVTSEYENGERKNIRVLDEDGKELEKISS